MSRRCGERAGKWQSAFLKSFDKSFAMKRGMAIVFSVFVLVTVGYFTRSALIEAGIFERTPCGGTQHAPLGASTC
jgi:hypothetical protein